MNYLNKKICALIPARSGSKSIIDKNIKKIKGLPLIQYSISAASSCGAINEVFLSSDSKKYLEIGKKIGAKPVLRPKNISTDSASTEDAILHFLQNHDYDVIVLIQPTSPMITSNILEDALEKFFNENLDSLTSVYKDHGFWWEDNKPLYDPQNRPMRQTQKKPV